VFSLVELRLDAVRYGHGRIISRPTIELLLGRIERVKEAAVTITCILVHG
jgi:hypothetical protein